MVEQGRKQNLGSVQTCFDLKKNEFLYIKLKFLEGAMFANRYQRFFRNTIESPEEIIPIFARNPT